MSDTNFTLGALRVLLAEEDAHYFPESADRLLQSLVGWAWDIGREQAEREKAIRREVRQHSWSEGYKEGLKDGES